MKSLFIGLLAFKLLCSSAAYAEGKFAIYFPTAAPIKDLQKAFEEDPALKGVKVLAFSDFEDFQIYLKSEDVTYVLAPSAFGKFYSEVTPLYQLTFEGKSTFRYDIVTLPGGWGKDKIAEGTAGFVNIVGRDNTKTLIDEIMVSKKFKRVKQVSKFIDLFPLLSLNNVQYALFTPQDRASVEKEYKSNTLVVLQTEEITYPFIGVMKNKSDQKGEFFAKLKTSTLKVLGLDGIKKLGK